MGLAAPGLSSLPPSADKPAVCACEVTVTPALGTIKAFMLM